MLSLLLVDHAAVSMPVIVQNKIGDLQCELSAKDDEIHRLKALLDMKN